MDTATSHDMIQYKRSKAQEAFVRKIKFRAFEELIHVALQKERKLELKCAIYYPSLPKIYDSLGDGGFIEINGM